MIEPVGEGTEIGERVLAEGEVLVRAVDGRLQVGQQRVYPGEARHLARLSRAHDDVSVCASIDDAREAAKPVAEHVGARQQRHARPVGDGCTGEADDRGEFGELGPG